MDKKNEDIIDDEIYGGAYNWEMNNRMMCNNVFRNCRSTNLKSLSKKGIIFKDNILSGNTVIETEPS